MDILCGGDLIDCRCLVKTEEGEVVQYVAGFADEKVKTEPESSSITNNVQMCSCNSVSHSPSEHVITRAACCSSSTHSSSNLTSVLCPPHLPHVTRYRSAHPILQCPPPSMPFKCLCLGSGDREDGTRKRKRGEMTGDSCSCQGNEELKELKATRVVC